MEILLTALRQYQHNDCSGFIFGYDKEETDKIVAELLKKIEHLTAADLRAHLVADYWCDKYEALKKQM